MDPNTGRVYSSLEEAKASGVANPVYIQGRPEDVERISSRVAAGNRADRRAAKRAQRKKNR